MKKLIMCEGPNELEIIRILLDNGKLIYSMDDLLDLRPYHARQLTSPALRGGLNPYPGKVEVLRIGDKMTDILKIPKEYQAKITGQKKYCTKPELEMLLIISNGLYNEYQKVKSTTKPKQFCKQYISYNGMRYDNSTRFYTLYYGSNVDRLVVDIREYKRLQSHAKGELYLVDLLK